MNRVSPRPPGKDRPIGRVLAAVVVLLAMLPAMGSAAGAFVDVQQDRGNPSIEVTKHRWPPQINEPGRKVAFGVEVTNTSPEPVAITAITDTLNGGPPVDVTYFHGPVLSTKCGDAIGTTLQPGGTYDCSFILFISGDPGDLVTGVTRVTAEDDSGATTSDQAADTIEILDVKPTIEVTKHRWPPQIYEPGRKVAFGVEVTNTSPEPVAITAITDTLNGGPPVDVTYFHGPVLSTKCGDAIGTTLQPGDAYDCSFILFISGDPGDLVTGVTRVTAEDDEANAVTGDAEETIEILDATPAIEVAKTADPVSLDEPGGDVTYTAELTNTYLEPVRIVAVVDSVAGGIPFDVTTVGGPVLATTCDDAIGADVAAHETYRCTFVLSVSGNAGDVVRDAVAFTVADDEGNEATESAEATVEITDATPTIQVDKAAAVESVTAPGAEVEFTVEVTNTSVEDTTITAITDQIGAGDPFDVTALTGPVLATTCDDAIGTTLAPSGTYRCEFTVLVASDQAGSVADTVRVNAVDNEENVATGEDGETVEVTLPAVEEPEPEPTFPVTPTTLVTPVTPTAPAPQVSPATQAPAAQATAAPIPAARATNAPLLAVTGRGSAPYAMVALLLVIGGITLVGYSRGRRASRLDG